eukprot:2849490-Heterocapsa_arctica.AAC.1
MKADTQYNNWTIPQKVDKLCACMASMSVLERKELSKLGAVRLSRKQAINFIHSCISTQYLYALMISCKVGDQDDCLGYILYENLGNKP